MIIKRFYNHAAAEYQYNVYEFISTEEGREKGLPIISVNR